MTPGPIWRGELALLIVVLINSFGVVLMARLRRRNLGNLQRTIRLLRIIPTNDTRHLDLHLSGHTRGCPDGPSKKIRSNLSLQLRSRLCLQQDAGCLQNCPCRSSNGTRISDLLLYRELCRPLHRNCTLQPLRTPDHPDRPVPA